jgi:hypothetical protein
VAAPTIVNPQSEITPLLKTQYPSPRQSLKRRRFQNLETHKARGFVRRTLRGRVPLTRPPRRT